MLTLRNDPTRPGGGHALLEGPGLDGIESLAVENLYSGFFLGRNGKWSKTRETLPITAVGPGVLSLGPHIVDFVPTESQIAFHAPGGAALGQVFWADIVPSRDPGRITAQDILGRPPKPPDAPPPAPLPVLTSVPSPEPPPVPAPDPIPDPIPEPVPIPKPVPEPPPVIVLPSPPPPPLLPTVWQRCTAVVRRHPSLLTPCAVAMACPLAFAFWMYLVFIPRDDVGGWNALLVFTSYVVAKACQHWAIRRTYALSEVTRGDPEPERSGALRFGAFLLLGLLLQPLVVFGTILLVLPGAAAAGLLAGTFPAVLLEGRNPSDAILRSASLAKGARLEAGFAVLTPVAALLLAQFVLTFFLVAALTRSNVAPGTPLSLATVWLLVPAAFPLSGIVSTVLFAELRRRSERPTAAAAQPARGLGAAVSGARA